MDLAGGDAAPPMNQFPAAQETHEASSNLQQGTRQAFPSSPEAGTSTHSWKDGCIFCDIVRGHPEGKTTRILYQDQQVAAFMDIRPASKLHYLVIPIDHIGTTDNLDRTQEHVKLVEHMVAVGQKLLHRDAPDAKGFRFGFHRPPFNSVNHLHLHCHALPYKSWLHAAKYIPLGAWGAYISADTLLQKLSGETGHAPRVPSK